MRQNDLTFIRYSVQAFNTQQDLDKLFNVLTEIIAEDDLITTH